MYSNRYQGNKGLTMVIWSGDNPYLKKEDPDKQFCHKENVYSSRSAHVSSYDLSPGSSMPFHSFLLPGTDKEQRIYEKQHVGILLLNIH